MNLDRQDIRILDAVQHDGSITNLELADKIGLSPSPCARRVKQLEEGGFIEKRVTLLNASKLNLKLTALIQISMDKHTPDRFELFEKQKKQYKESIIGSKKCFAIEAGVVNGWEKYVDCENFLGMKTFGASGPYKELYDHFGITVKNLVNKIKNNID